MPVGVKAGGLPVTLAVSKTDSPSLPVTGPPPESRMVVPVLELALLIERGSGPGVLEPV